MVDFDVTIQLFLLSGVPLMTNANLSMVKWAFHPASEKATESNAHIVAGDECLLFADNDPETTNNLAERLIECTNACRGLSTTDLKESGLVSAVGHQLSLQDKAIGDLLDVVTSVLKYVDDTVPSATGLDRHWINSVVDAATDIVAKPEKSFTVYVCTSCEGIYLEKVSRCDCMPDKQEFDEYLAIPTKKV